MSLSISLIPKHLKAFALAFCLAWLPTNLAWAAGESIVETIRALIERGNSLLSHGSYEAAIAEYEKVLDKEPNNPYAKSNIVLAHNNWGITYFKQGKLELAKREWDTALKLDPNDKNAHNNIAVLKRELAKQGKTLDDIDTEKKAETAKKEKEAAEKAPSSAVVMLSAPQKQPGSESSSEAGVSGSGAQIMTPANNSNSSGSGAQIMSSQSNSGSGAQIMSSTPNSSNIGSNNNNSGSGGMILSGGTSSGPANSAISSPEKAASSANGNANGSANGSANGNAKVDKGGIQTYGQQGYAQNVPAQAESAPAVPKTKAQEELEAFKRLTSAGDKAAAQEPSSSSDGMGRSSPSNGAPLVFHSSARIKTDTGESADFMDDKLGGQSNSQANPQSSQVTNTQSNYHPSYQSAPQANPRANSQANSQSNSQANPPYQFMRPPDQQNSTGTTDGAQQTSSSNEESKQSRKHHSKKQVAEASPQSTETSITPNSPNSIDGVLNRLEVKIYGQSTTESSIIKRIERMETDSFGRPSVGAISARLARLKKMYNVSD